MILSHRIALNPTNRQQTYFRKACGTARFAYNWALTEWQRQYAAGEKPTVYLVDKALNAIKREQFPWMQEVTKHAAQKGVHQLGNAFDNFFAKRSCFPKFRKKCQYNSFVATVHNTDNQPVMVVGRKFFCPKLGWVRMRESLRFEGKILSAVVSRTADRWFVSLAVEMPDILPPVRENQSVGGVDLGIIHLATLSDGTKVEGPKALQRNLGRLRRASRQLSRKQKGSANRQKAKFRVSRLHARVANIRKDVLHKLTTNLVKRFSVIGIEDLNVRGMSKNRRLARSIQDMGWGEFRRQLDYKAPLAGSRVVVVNRWFPSSKTCSACGCVATDMPLMVREWVCNSCGTRHDRDINAAINLAAQAAAINLAAQAAATAVLAGSNACGDESSGSIRKRRAKLTSAKQERINTKV